jgi:hypothetical protein
MSVGKTTLVNALKEYDEFKAFTNVVLPTLIQTQKPILITY